MKIQSLVVSIALALGTSAFAAGDKHDHAHEHKPLHGGVVVEVSDIDFELVAKTDVLTLYVRDHGKNTSTAGASAKLMLLTAGEKAEVTLTPAGDNKLEAKGSFKVGKGSKAVATVILKDKKPVNVRFSL